MEKCKICRKEFETRKQKSIHERFCREAKEKYGHIPIEELKYLYYEKEYSIADLSKYYKVGKGLLNFMRRNNFKLRNIRESKTTRVKNKYKDSNLERYGKPHNFCKNHPSRIKWESDLLKTEGISNVFQRISVKEKIKETLIERYGVDHPMRCEEIVEKVMSSRQNSTCFIRFSSIHRKICDELDKMGIKYEIEHYIKGENIRCFYDIKIGNLLIEINGNYWHANPLFYKANDLLSFHGKEFTAQNIWELDKKKIDFGKENNFHVIQIWESEISENIENVKQKILIEYEKSKNKVN